ncbi:hypothetical protein TNIN_118411 [Trichonephila inaurata madagascariensis]|uniref:Uncharacterized protein n=1 Tax=Trichonephila inaurata madagascariensis TaxID=2747483 RepID=A0A8X6MCV1_9ARAC|nr:hypothetical protein TNIN_118411 [Trichonephila inaurata madagascariensis]
MGFSNFFQDEFRQGTPQERLEQTTMMFLLRLVALAKEEMHIRTFRKPVILHEAVQADSLLKHTFALLTLILYNVRWTQYCRLCLGYSNPHQAIQDHHVKCHS